MSIPKIMYCPGNLSAVKNETYSLVFRKVMFAGARLSHILDFQSPGKYVDQAEDIELTKHLSISGVQIKFSLRKDGNKLVKTERQGEYIIKPIPTGVRYAETVPANEHLTMQLAKQVYGITTAENGMIFYSDEEPAYITKRFDRKVDGTKSRQEDFAQLTERSQESHGENYKYDFSYEELAQLMRRYIPAYIPEIEKLFRLIVFNYLFSNGDGHLKNFSLLETKDGDHVLAPAYDLLCSRIHSPTERDLAPTAGLFADHMTPSFAANGFYAYDDFYELGIRYGIAPVRVERILNIFKTRQVRIDELIDRSFLNEDMKVAYRNHYADRLARLNYSFNQQ